MYKTFVLTKILLKSIYDSDATKKKRKINLGPFGIVLLVLLMVGSLSLPIYLAASSIAKTLSTINATHLLIYVILPIAALLIMFLSIFTIISVFFLSTDNAILLPLPLKPYQLILARFFSTLFITYIIELVIFLPILIGIGVGAHLGFDFYVISVITTIGLPIIPVAIIGLLLTYITRFTNMAKHKDLLTYISFAFILAISLGFNFAFSSMMSQIELDPNSIYVAITQLAGQLKVIITSLFPYLIPASEALTASSLITRILYALLYIAINGVALVIFAYFGGLIYYKTILGSGENPTKKKTLSSDDFGKSTKTTSIYQSYVLVEWRLMLRSPIYFLNLILVIILMPVILFASVFSSTAASGTNIDMNDILALLGGSGGFNVGNASSFLIALAVLIFLSSISMISSTAISRMGSTSDFVKYIPVKPITQLRAKMFWGIFLSVFLSIMMLGLFMFLGVMNLVDSIIILIPAIAVIYALNYLGLLVDLKRPKLTWTTEASAVKSNLNSMIVLFASWGLAGLLIGATFLLKLNTIANGGYYAAALTTLGGTIVTYLLYRYYDRPCKDVFKTF